MQVQGQKIVVLGTGGTIAGTAASATDNVGYTAAQIGVQQLLAAVPAHSGLELVSEQVAQMDSKDMSWALWQHLLRRCVHWLAQDDVQGLVITHGTDTLEETAYLLQAVLAPSKPVVLTCAMRPATAISPDGPQNLVDALAVASLREACGVSVVCAGTIHSAMDVQKIDTWRLDAFSSGDGGVLGYVQQGLVLMSRHWVAGAGQLGAAALERVLGLERLPRVEIVWSHAEASGATVDVLTAPDLAQRFGAPAVRGLVVAATGNGTLHHELQAALLRAQAQGIRVWRASRCAQGRIVPTAHDIFPESRGLTPVKARIALMLELAAESAAKDQF
jgi:L-asparaginase